MSQSTKENATHISNLTGRLREGTADTPDSGVAGRGTGEVVYRTDTDEIRIYDGTRWWGAGYTTSTSTSTTTTSTSTTTTSTSTSTTTS